jgi:hypothetical protein
LGVLGVLGVLAVFGVFGLFEVLAVLAVLAVLGVFAVFGVGDVFTIGAAVAPVVSDPDALVDGLTVGVVSVGAGLVDVDAAGDGLTVSAVAIAAPPRTVRPRAPVTAQAAVERLIRMMSSFRGVDRCPHSTRRW